MSCLVVLFISVLLHVNGVRIGDDDNDNSSAATSLATWRLSYNTLLESKAKTNMAALALLRQCPTGEDPDNGKCDFANIAASFDTFPETSDDDRQLLRRMLATAAQDVYEPTEKLGDGTTLTMEKCIPRDRRVVNEYKVIDPAVDKPIRTGVYRIEKGPFKGRKILAVRGTSNMHDWLAKNMNLLGVNTETRNVTYHEDGTVEMRPTNESGFELTVQYVERVVDEEGITHKDFITGHSLGGAVAELVALRKSINGAAFNAPAVCSQDNVMNFCGMSQSKAKRRKKANVGQKRLRFEVWLTELDAVSFAGGRDSALARDVLAPKEGQTWMGSLGRATMEVGSVASQAVKAMLHPIRTGQKTLEVGGIKAHLARTMSQSVDTTNDVNAKIRLVQKAKEWASTVDKGLKDSHGEKCSLSDYPGEIGSRQALVEKSHIAVVQWVRCIDTEGFIVSLHGMDCMINQPKIGGPLQGNPPKGITFDDLAAVLNVTSEQKKNLKAMADLVTSPQQCPVEDSEADLATYMTASEKVKKGIFDIPATIRGQHSDPVNAGLLESLALDDANVGDFY